MSQIPTTCTDFVEHPHMKETTFTSAKTGETIKRIAGCYSCQEASASEYQGTSQIAKALVKAGIQNVQVEQTGGFTMVVYV